MAALLEQAIGNLGYSDAYYPYLIKNGIDSIRALNLIIEKGHFYHLNFIPIGHWLTIQSEANNIVNAQQQQQRMQLLSIPAIAQNHISQSQPIKIQFSPEFNAIIKNVDIESGIHAMTKQKDSNSDNTQIIHSKPMQNEAGKQTKQRLKCTKNENERLKELVGAGNGSIDWLKIAKKLGTERSASSVKQNYRRVIGNDTKSKQSKKATLWTEDEEGKLQRILNKRQDKNSSIDWKEITKLFNDENGTKRSEIALRARYGKMKNKERAQLAIFYKSRFSTRVPRTKPTASPNVNVSEYLCKECECKLAQMDAEDVYDGNGVFCDGSKCSKESLSDTVYHCPNGHDYCSECVASKEVKIESNQQSESQSMDENEIEIMNGDGWDFKQCEVKKNVIDIDDGIDLKPKMSEKCPISLQLMTNPFKSTRCGHVFDKDAVLNYLKNYRAQPNKRKNSFVPCPIIGCSQRFKEEHLESIKKKKRRRRSSFDINHCPSAKKMKRTFADFLPVLSQ